MVFKTLLIMLIVVVPMTSLGIEVLQVKGKTFTFETPNLQNSTKKRILVFRKSPKERMKKIVLGQIIKVNGTRYTAKVVKRFYKKARVSKGLEIKVSKRYLVRKKNSKMEKVTEKKGKLKQNEQVNFLAKIRPLGFATGYFDAEAEFALKGSSKSFSLLTSYIGLESNTDTVKALGFLGKYNLYFSERAISQGFYFSGIFGLYIMTASGFATNGALINVDLYVPYIGGTFGYQILFNKSSQLRWVGELEFILFQARLILHQSQESTRV